MRLRTLVPWVREWALPEMHAGIPEMGAVDAWIEVLTMTEELKLDGKDDCGWAADIAKFFDQVRRGLVYRIKAAGMPQPILDAYRAYLENLLVYNCLAGGIGRPTGDYVAYRKVAHFLWRRWPSLCGLGNIDEKHT